MPAVPHSQEAARRVLVVEDQEDCLAMMVELISTQGCEVRVARDGQTALCVAQEFLPHVILLDLGLPVIHGYEVAKALRRDPRTQHAVIVAVTGYGMESDRVRSAQAGIDRHLIKPVAFEELAGLLRLHGVSDWTPLS
ncbi:response regulator [Ramlibacter henchirensis]|uniref:Response regulator n=1 Tax=Ramlibacter henchirensis TaxID=204072 RepID=A0A4Z0BXR9_9BURK|nr:response regulator [Ramlibacter henchirensis]TFZ03088.1 response regulator [Ramlibacter henchirensis]